MLLSHDSVLLFPFLQVYPILNIIFHSSYCVQLRTSILTEPISYTVWSEYFFSLTNQKTTTKQVEGLFICYCNEKEPKEDLWKCECKSIKSGLDKKNMEKNKKIFLRHKVVNRYPGRGLIFLQSGQHFLDRPCNNLGCAVFTFAQWFRVEWYLKIVLPNVVYKSRTANFIWYLWSIFTHNAWDWVQTLFQP